MIFNEQNLKKNLKGLILGDYYAVSTIDFDETKKYIEIVDWRKVDSKEFDRMIRKVSAEGGQFLIKAVDR